MFKGGTVKCSQQPCWCTFHHLPLRGCSGASWCFHSTCSAQEKRLAASTFSRAPTRATEPGPELTEHMHACIQKCRGTSGSGAAAGPGARKRSSHFGTGMDVFVLWSVTSLPHLSVTWDECKTMLEHLTKFLSDSFPLSVSVSCIFYLMSWFWNKSSCNSSCFFPLSNQWRMNRSFI